MLPEMIKMMNAVKRELGFSENCLVFIGMADTAKVRWCEQQAVYANRGMEIAFFGAFVDDILEYSTRLGYAKKRERISARRLLELRNSITPSDIEKLLERSCQVEGIFVSDPTLDLKPIEDLISSGASPREVARKIAMLPPTVQGEILEHFRERYPTIRWNFDWNDYVVVGVPDGIAREFVYEFKTTRDRGLLRWVRPSAFAQGDLYGYFFKRKTKRIQIMTRNNANIYTWHVGVDKRSALDCLKRLRDVEKGERSPVPPASWKCEICRFKNRCSIFPLMS